MKIKLVIIQVFSHFFFPYFWNRIHCLDRCIRSSNDVFGSKEKSDKFSFINKRCWISCRSLKCNKNFQFFFYLKIEKKGNKRNIEKSLKSKSFCLGIELEKKKFRSSWFEQIDFLISIILTRDKYLQKGSDFPPEINIRVQRHSKYSFT